MADEQSRIVIDPKILVGKPIVRGTPIADDPAIVYEVIGDSVLADGHRPGCSVRRIPRPVISKALELPCGSCFGQTEQLETPGPDADGFSYRRRRRVSVAKAITAERAAGSGTSERARFQSARKSSVNAEASPATSSGPPIDWPKFLARLSRSLKFTWPS